MIEVVALPSEINDRLERSFSCLVLGEGEWMKMLDWCTLISGDVCIYAC